MKLASVSTTNLLQRWPDEILSKSFRDLLVIYRKLFEQHLKQSGNPQLSLHESYTTICGWIQDSFINFSQEVNRDGSGHSFERRAVRSIFLDLKAFYGNDWLQAVASILGMIMHYSVDSRDSSVLVNLRRPQKLFSTYPNSPSVARFVGEAVVSSLVRQPIPTACYGVGVAERYAEQALTFRILDPSMESGQLLVEVALACVRKVHAKHSPSSKTARYLINALLEKLCRDCLLGIDRNELAVNAVSLIFKLMGAEFGNPSLSLPQLSTSDWLECSNQGQLSQFDAIVNNPPWGEAIKTAERMHLRSRFTSLNHKSDTYVAFAELTIRSLKPGGIFTLILPSQVLATQNTSRLRDLFSSQTEIGQILLLPRAAFARATVRGLILLGRKHPVVSTGRCRVIFYPLIKRFDAVGPTRSFSISSAELRRVGKNSWWPLISAGSGKTGGAPVLTLERVAVVAFGVQPYKKGGGVPPQTDDVVKSRPFTLLEPAAGTVPAIQGRDVHSFHVGNPRQFIKFGKWLAYMGNHESLRHSARVFVRELCRRDGKLTAAVAADGPIPLHGVLTVVPKMINVHALVGILNSAAAADYVSKHSASFSKVDFQKITVSELRQMPIPIAAINPARRRALGLSPATDRELLLYKRLVNLTRRLSHTAPRGDSRTRELSREVDAVVSEMYGL